MHSTLFRNNLNINGKKVLFIVYVVIFFLISLSANSKSQTINNQHHETFNVGYEYDQFYGYGVTFNYYQELGAYITLRTNYFAERPLFAKNSYQYAVGMSGRVSDNFSVYIGLNLTDVKMKYKYGIDIGWYAIYKFVYLKIGFNGLSEYPTLGMGLSF